MLTVSTLTQEHQRLHEIVDDHSGWRRWGTYVSDRAWGTVREDYSDSGDAWGYLPHDLARSKAYRWGEDGIGGLCDRYQLLVFAPAFWNRRDPFLKERLFGLTGPQGNHGEDVKEYYFYQDALPSHAYMRMLYRYPQQAFPYDWLVYENQARQGQGFEFELVDTGVFDDNRYFDITIEYAKATPEDICIRIEAVNRGPEGAPLDLIPQLWFRNIWSWAPHHRTPPIIEPTDGGEGYICLLADNEKCRPPHDILHYQLGPRYLYAPAGGTMVFTDNETNADRVFGPGFPSSSPYTKDAFHRHLCYGEPAINPDTHGTKAGIVYRFDEIPPGKSVVLEMRLSDRANLPSPLEEARQVLRTRREEADRYYETIHPKGATEDEKHVQRQAFAGLLWTKQSYIYNVHVWLNGDDPAWPPPASRELIRNSRWRHLNSMRVMSVPDKWEYPWFAAWDLAFHCVALALVDSKYAKEQLWVLLFEQFQHPNGQIPAYEWEFSDLNPPVHAWSVWRVYNMDRIRTGTPDRQFLEKCFHKLLINFAWWVNKVDSQGNNIFEGGFLGLDNITVFDRSMKLDGGAVLEQSDATGWMGMFCLNLMRIALELAKDNAAYESLATKFFQHYVYVAAAMKKMGNRNYQLWDDEDGFFYDVLRYPGGDYLKLRVRSLVGLIPLYAVERLEMDWIRPFSKFTADLEWFLTHRQDLCADIIQTVERDGRITHILTIVNQDQLTRLLQRVFDPDEFLSDYGIRSMSKAHETRPFMLPDKIVSYEPAEAGTKIKGGNSNWRGPIWFPTNFLLIESLRKLGKAYGPDFTVETPTGRVMHFEEMAQEVADRLIRIFSEDDGRRAVWGGSRKFQGNDQWRDNLLFYEYFHGDNGAGLGASHQTGWTALVASLIDEWR